MPVQYLSLVLAVTLLSSCVALPFEKDIEEKFSSYKEKFDKKVQMPSWNANGFGYQIVVGKVSEPAANPPPGVAESPAPAPHQETSPVAPAPAPHPESAPVASASAPQPPAAIPAPESPAPPSAHAPHASGTQAQANSGTNVGGSESAASGGTSARKIKSPERGLAPQRLINWG